MDQALIIAGAIIGASSLNTWIVVFVVSRSDRRNDERTTRSETRLREDITQSETRLREDITQSETRLREDIAELKRSSEKELKALRKGQASERKERAKLGRRLEAKIDGNFRQLCNWLFTLIGRQQPPVSIDEPPTFTDAAPDVPIEAPTTRPTSPRPTSQMRAKGR